MLKPASDNAKDSVLSQPPPRGCVLKLRDIAEILRDFGSRLRAAVCWNIDFWLSINIVSLQPPPRGCVLKRDIPVWWRGGICCSRLRAAVCWNNHCEIVLFFHRSSRLRAAVCWNIKLYDPMQQIYGCNRLRVAVCWNRRLGTVPDRYECSRLRAAVCWNKVEDWSDFTEIVQPPSGGMNDVFVQQVARYGDGALRYYIFVKWVEGRVKCGHFLYYFLSFVFKISSNKNL